MPSASNLPPRNCAVCGTEFSPKHARAKYCQKKCLWKAKNDASYARNPEKMREHARKGWAKHREKRIAYLREHYANNRELFRARADAAYQRTRQEAPWLIMLASAKHRAKKSGIEFSLDLDWAETRWTGFCELSKLPFVISEKKGEGRGMFSPTIDRIDSSKGYTKDNSRFLLWAVNAFKNVGTDEEVFRIAEALVLNKPR